MKNKSNKKNIKYKELEAKYKILLNAYNLACKELYSRTITMYSEEQLKKFKEYLIVKGNEYANKNEKVCTKA